MEISQNHSIYITPVRDYIKKYHQGVLDQIGSSYLKICPTPHEDMQEISHSNKTFPSKTYRTWSPELHYRAKVSMPNVILMHVTTNIATGLFLRINL